MTGTLTDSIAALATSAAASLVFKATLVLAAGLLATALARRARASVRHALLTSTLAVVLALPAGAALMPALAIPVPLAPPTPQVSPAIEVAQQTGDGLTSGCRRDATDRPLCAGLATNNRRLGMGCRRGNAGWVAGAGRLAVAPHPTHGPPLARSPTPRRRPGHSCRYYTTR